MSEASDCDCEQSDPQVRSMTLLCQFMYILSIRQSGPDGGPSAMHKRNRLNEDV